MNRERRDAFESVSWDRLRVFVVVAEAGSFTRAGIRLGLSQSAVSRQVIDLEASLKVALFYRQARGLVLTEQGEMLFKSLQGVASEIVAALARIDENAVAAQGPLNDHDHRRLRICLAHQSHHSIPRPLPGHQRLDRARGFSGVESFVPGSRCRHPIREADAPERHTASPDDDPLSLLREPAVHPTARHADESGRALLS